MEREYKKAFDGLNVAQRQAVTAIDGPLLVVAGPGTGKTQLLSTRVGHILHTTDTVPENILCLTFTESGARSMRQRLLQLIGETAYSVQIGTYHAFGSELLRRYPEFSDSPGLEPIDDIGMNSLLREILEEVPYSNPYKYSELYVSDLLGFISESKRALLTPEMLRDIAKENQQFIDAGNTVVTPILQNFKRIDKASAALFQELLHKLEALKSTGVPKNGIEPLGDVCRRELSEALLGASETGKTTPLTKWKNKWLARGEQAQMILAGGRINDRLRYAADIYARYRSQLQKRSQFDYDDMILRAISSLEAHPDFKLTLAERYQYILLDEFQDTNPSQLRLIELITDSPINEGRPNVMAVGDDDQAIYAFQGAHYSNMLKFLDIYRDVRLITLKQNYRSHRDILHITHGVAQSIETRLVDQLKGEEKILEAAGKNLPPKAEVARHEFASEPDELAWVAGDIAGRIKSGIPAQQIAVLAPKHRYLQALLPYLSDRRIAVWYEKRENVLDEPHIRMLEQMARLCLALRGSEFELSDSLWTEVLSYEFWGIPTEAIWRLSWEAHSSGEPWTNLLLQNPATKPVVAFFLELSSKLHITTLEQQLDALTGVDNEDTPLPSSTFFEYYFKDKAATQYLSLVGNLTVLRGHLRRFGRESETPQSLADFVRFIDAHRRANLPVINTSPYHANDNSVQLMTAYKSKGLEFEAVYLLSATENVWGGASRSRGNLVSLPINLMPIRYGGADDDERRRLLYVAATRAKSTLILTSHTHSFDGRRTSRLAYIESAPITVTEHAAAQGEAMRSNIELYWVERHLPPVKPSLESLLNPRLDRYQLSATHINNFIDIINCGPHKFFINSILRFPKTPSSSGQFGNAVHETLEWANRQVAAGTMPSEAAVIAKFDSQLLSKRLSPMDTQLLKQRGNEALHAYWPAMGATYKPGDMHEYRFGGEGVFVGDAHLTGTIDKLVINKKDKTITVVDFKTGKSHSRWDRIAILHKYRQQLIFYKLLIEGSHTFRGYGVSKGILEFIEPDEHGRIIRLELEYSEAEIVRFKKLIAVIWKKIHALDFPDTSGYDDTLKGITAFENDLIDGLV